MNWELSLADRSLIIRRQVETVSLLAYLVLKRINGESAKLRAIATEWIVKTSLNIDSRFFYVGNIFVYENYSMTG